MGQNQLSFLIGRKGSSTVLTECNDRSQIHSQTCTLAKLRSQRGTHYLPYTCPNGTTYLFTQPLFCYGFFFTNIFLMSHGQTLWFFLYSMFRVKFNVCWCEY